MSNNWWSNLINFLTTNWAVPVSVIVYVMQKFFVPQILEYRELLKRARYDIIYYANIFPLTDKEGRIVNIEDLSNASKELRVVGARIRAHRENILCYDWIAKFGLVPKREISEEMASCFIGWSNEMYSTQPGQSGRQIFRKKIAKLLGMQEY